MNDERTEDLNPRTEDIEEKVKQLMDLSIPDVTEPAISESKKRIKIESIAALPPKSDGDTPILINDLLGLHKTPSSQGKSARAKTVLSEGEVPDIEEKPFATEVMQSRDEGVLRKTSIEVNSVAEPIDTKLEPESKKIKITSHDDDTQAEVAEKLDEVIAELGSIAPAKKTSALLPDEAKIDKDESGDELLAEMEVISSPETDNAISEIIVADSDELLEIEDAVKDTSEPLVKSRLVPKNPRRNLAQYISLLWNNLFVRWCVIFIVVASLLTALFLPGSRYFMLNTTGVRASSSLVVMDQSTGQPLKNVEIKIGNVSNLTDIDGKVRLSKIKLGPAQLMIHKNAFAPITKRITIGFGSNPLGDFTLVPTGSQYSFTAVDFLSGKPISKIEASSGTATALSDDNGLIKLTIDKPDEKSLLVTLRGDTYRAEQLNIEPDNQSNHIVKFVPARKQVYVSKRSGKYDIYSVYIDGKNEKLILAGSGSEREDMVIVPHQVTDTVAYVSTRGNQHNSDGFLMSNLILINLNDNSTTNVAMSERIRIVDWSDDSLVYVMTAAGSSANDPKRYRLLSYNYKEGTSKELASSNYFNDVIAVNGTIYYAPSNAYQGEPGFYSVKADGSDLKTLFNQEVWNIFRTKYERLTLSVQQQWFEYGFDNKIPTRVNNAPTEQVSRVYIESVDGKHNVWIDKRDGKGVLLDYDKDAKKDTTLHSQSGLSYPVRWLNNKTLVYRVKTDQETTDYAMSIDGGTPVKISDVTNSGGIDRWYY